MLINYYLCCDSIESEHELNTYRSISIENRPMPKIIISMKCTRNNALHNFGLRLNNMAVSNSRFHSLFKNTFT